MGVIHKIGRRKCAVARVYVSEGTGKITVNKREFTNYFPTATLQYKVLQPMSMTENVLKGRTQSGVRLICFRAMCRI